MSRGVNIQILGRTLRLLHFQFRGSLRINSTNRIAGPAAGDPVEPVRHFEEFRNRRARVTAQPAERVRRVNAHRNVGITDRSNELG